MEGEGDLEVAGEWPDVRLGVIMCIPKGRDDEEDEEDKWEADEVVLGDAGATGPITNIVSAYDFIRYSHFAVATEAMVTEDCHGGRTLLETHDVSLRYD